MAVKKYLNESGLTRFFNGLKSYFNGTATPLMDGTASVGSSHKFAKEDHVHPTDTSKVSLDYLQQNYLTEDETYDYVSDNYYSKSELDEHITTNYLTANQIEANYATIANLTNNYLNTVQLQAQYAEVDLLNVNNEWLQNGYIKNAAISSSMINSLDATKITTGTLNAGLVNIINLNASEITTGRLTVNGFELIIDPNATGGGSIELDGANITDGTIPWSGLAREVADRIDGAIETFTGDAVPTLLNYPVSGWAAAEYDSHVGDVYYVVNDTLDQDGYCYRFSYDNTNDEYLWSLIKDSQVTRILSDLITAQDDIDSIQNFNVTLSERIDQTDEGVTEVRGKTTELETAVGNSVTKSEFAETVNTVGTISDTLSSMSDVLEKKADGDLVEELKTDITNVSETAGGVSTKINSLITTLGFSEDGTIETDSDKTVYDRMVATETWIEANSEKISQAVSKTEIDGISGQIDSIRSEFSQTAETVGLYFGNNGAISSWFTFDENQFTIGKENSPIKSIQDNSSYKYVDGSGAELLKIDTDGITSDTVNVESQIKIVHNSNDQWAIRKGTLRSGVGVNFDIVWIGG